MTIATWPIPHLRHEGLSPASREQVAEDREWYVHHGRCDRCRSGPLEFDYDYTRQRYSVWTRCPLGHVEQS